MNCPNKFLRSAIACTHTQGDYTYYTRRERVLHTPQSHREDYTHHKHTECITHTMHTQSGLQKNTLTQRGLQTLYTQRRLHTHTERITHTKNKQGDYTLTHRGLYTPFTHRDYIHHTLTQRGLHTPSTHRDYIHHTLTQRGLHTLLTHFYPTPIIPMSAIQNNADYTNVSYTE